MFAGFSFQLMELVFAKANYLSVTILNKESFFTLSFDTNQHVILDNDFENFIRNLCLVPGTCYINSFVRYLLYVKVGTN